MDYRSSHSVINRLVSASSLHRQDGSPRGDLLLGSCIGQLHWAVALNWLGSQFPRLRVSLVSALPDSYFHEPRDAKFVIPARCGAPFHKITVPPKRPYHFKRCALRPWFKVPSSASKLSRHNTIYYAEVPRFLTGPTQMGNLTASQNFPLHV